MFSGFTTSQQLSSYSYIFYMFVIVEDLIAGNEVLSVMPNVCLALFLHFEKYNPESKYKPYLGELP